MQRCQDEISSLRSLSMRNFFVFGFALLKSFSSLIRLAKFDSLDVPSSLTISLLWTAKKRHKIK
jgi:hypothetical protein